MAGMNPGSPIRLSKSCLGDEEKRAVVGVLGREFLGMGAEVQQFEHALADYFGRPVVCVVNGTAALQLALQACGIGAGDEVLVQSLTYVASFQAISATGAVAMACDVDPQTLTLDLADAERRVTPKTRAIMPVHYSGGVGALAELHAFARKHGLRVIEDAAHAFGTTHQGLKVGGFGDIACFSFDGIKNITSGEGGCVVTDDPDVLQRIRDARLLGVERDTEKRFQGQRSWEFEVTAQGWRYHMSNIMAAIGIQQLKRFPHLAVRRQALASHYDRLLQPVDGIVTLPHDYTQVVPHIYVVRIPSMIDRDAVRARMLALGIETGAHYFPNHKLAYFRPSQETLPLRTTDSVYPQLLSLPLHPDLDDSAPEYIVKSLREVLGA